jgi:hypothetical protein
MSYDDDEMAEGGDIHEVNGRTYSVVGDNVYVKGLFGWNMVEDEDEEAEAGDIREVNNSTYSLVGNTVYRKNWVGGWDEVDDEDERAEAGDRDERNGTEYSRVGGSIYKKELFGWTLVEDEDEEAEGGDIREVNNSTYSIVGNTVYRKDLFGWTEVEDDDEMAEAGDHSDFNGATYSRVGNLVFKQELFGWTRLDSDDDDDDDRDTSYSPSYSSDYSSDDSSSGSYSSPGSSGPSSSKSTPTGTIIFWVVIVIGAILLYGWLTGNHQQQPEQQAYTAPVAQPQAQEPPPPANPYGDGNGQASFYRICEFCRIEVFNDSTSYGNIPTPVVRVGMNCNEPDMLRVVIASGSHTFTFKNENGDTWQQTVEVPNGDCLMVKVEQPPPPAPATDTAASPPTTGDTQQQPEPAAFNLLSPADHSSFSYPRYTNVQWSSDPDADSYEVDLQLSNAPYDYTATVYSPMPYANGGIYTTTNTSITVQGMGKQVHRVRVKAIKNATVIAVTPWSYFDYVN